MFPCWQNSVKNSAIVTLMEALVSRSSDFRASLNKPCPSLLNLACHPLWVSFKPLSLPITLMLQNGLTRARHYIYIFHLYSFTSKVRSLTHITPYMYIHNIQQKTENVLGFCVFFPFFFLILTKHIRPISLPHFPLSHLSS